MHGDYAEEKNAMRKLAGMAPEEVREPHSVDGGMENPLIQGEGEEELNEFLPILPVVGAVGSAIGRGLATSAIRAASAMHSDEEEETDEGIRGALAGGALGGAATRSVKGAVVGAKLGSAIQDRFAEKEETDENDASLFDDAVCNMSEAGENCSVHGMEECYGADTSPLAGQYGHSGKMKEVGKETSFLDRLKELSGMSRN
jgi:hypothetical protein